ncbi:hypothetical protein [Neisseria sicca]|jgi:hypothetical protein|uniref:hypothetical protein n=1 Tax=Neisseria sicca TaxID=490 RepID=UPI001F0C8444|nr:hypothetical protein [Neisseria sicca]
MMNIEKVKRRLSIMKTFNRKLMILAGLLVMTACTNQSNLTLDGKQNVQAAKTKQKNSPPLHFECHPSENKFNTLPEIPPPLPNVTSIPISLAQQRKSAFRDETKRLAIPMNKELIIPKLQELGFIEDSSNEIYEKNFGKKNMYDTVNYNENIFSITITLKDIIDQGCPYYINIYHVNNEVNGVEILIGNDGLILKDTTIPDLVVSNIDHKHKPENLFKDLLDKHIQNIEAFKQKQPLNEELISTRAVYDGITYEINSFGGGRETMLQIYRYKTRKKVHN